MKNGGKKKKIKGMKWNLQFSRKSNIRVTTEELNAGIGENWKKMSGGYQPDKGVTQKCGGNPKIWEKELI